LVKIELIVLVRAPVRVEREEQEREVGVVEEGVLALLMALLVSPRVALLASKVMLPVAVLVAVSAEKEKTKGAGGNMGVQNLNVREKRAVTRSETRREKEKETWREQKMGTRVSTSCNSQVYRMLTYM